VLIEIEEGDVETLDQKSTDRAFTGVTGTALDLLVT